MKEIDGHVFLAESREAEFMFGKPVHEGCRIYENIETNGFNPYESSEEARKAAGFFASRFLFRSKFFLISLGKLGMKIAETSEELDFFRNKTGLIVIMKDYDDISHTDRLFGPGPVKKGRKTLYTIPGALLSANGYISYKKGNEQTPFERAKYQLTEINRQGRAGAVIAQFKLSRLEELFRG